MLLDKTLISYEAIAVSNFGISATTTVTVERDDCGVFVSVSYI